MIGAPIRSPVLLTIRMTIFLADITNLSEYHLRYDGKGCHGHD